MAPRGLLLGEVRIAKRRQSKSSHNVEAYDIYFFHNVYNSFDGIFTYPNFNFKCTDWGLSWFTPTVMGYFPSSPG